jgi:hypothetical protein
VDEILTGSAAVNDQVVCQDPGAVPGKAQEYLVRTKRISPFLLFTAGCRNGTDTTGSDGTTPRTGKRK